MHAMIVPIAAFVAVVALGGALLSARKARQARVVARLDRPVRGRVEPARRLTLAVSGVGQKMARGGPSSGLRQRLAGAGYYDQHAASIYLGSKIFLLFIGMCLLGALLWPLKLPASTRLFLPVAGGALLSFVPNLIVSQRRRQRLLSVRQHLPDSLDLLEICVSAGLGLDAAWNSVADEMRPVCPVLADEMSLANLEMHLGAPRAEALRNLATRTGADEVSSLVGALVQSDRFGTSIADTLRAFAGSMREIRSSRAEEAAEKMAVKLILPMVVFIFPAILVVAAGPSVIALARVIGGH
jgi:tight adherence protein C